MEYYCSECKSLNQILLGEPILCKLCGARILYKPRTKKIIEYEAR
nr:DNA-directed RNA polymerases I, II and III [Cryptomonas curvata]